MPDAAAHQLEVALGTVQVRGDPRDIGRCFRPRERSGGEQDEEDEEDGQGTKQG